MNTKKSVWMLTALTALLLTGCKFQATTDVRPGGSGELRTEVGFSAEERQNLEKQNPGTAQDFCNTSKAPAGVIVTQEQRGDETWCVTVTSFSDLEALRRLYEQRQGLTVNRLEIAGGEFYYDIDIDTSSQASSFSTFTAIGWTLTLPGAPISTNAEQTRGNMLTWTIQPGSGAVHLQAVSEAPQAFPLSLAIAVGAIILLLGGAAIFWMRRVRK